MRNRQPSLWREDEFFAFFGLRLGSPAKSRRGKERKWAESFCSLPSRLAARDGAQVGLHRSLILRPSMISVALLKGSRPTGRLKESRWTIQSRKK